MKKSPLRFLSRLMRIQGGTISPQANSNAIVLTQERIKQGQQLKKGNAYKPVLVAGCFLTQASLSTHKQRLRPPSPAPNPATLIDERSAAGRPHSTLCGWASTFHIVRLGRGSLLQVQGPFVSQPVWTASDGRPGQASPLQARDAKQADNDESGTTERREARAGVTTPSTGSQQQGKTLAQETRESQPSDGSQARLTGSSKRTMRK